MIKDINLDDSFSGNFDLLKCLLDKYKNVLGYKDIKEFAKLNGYKDFNTCSYRWMDFGVPQRVWYMLHKDLLISHLMGKLDAEECDLRKLKEEF